MTPDTKNERHCSFCTKVAVEQQSNGAYVCADHRQFLPWGVAVLNHLRGNKVVSTRQPVAQK